MQYNYCYNDTETDTQKRVIILEVIQGYALVCLRTSAAKAGSVDGGEFAVYINVYWCLRSEEMCIFASSTNLTCNCCFPRKVVLGSIVDESVEKE